ncbi:MAG: NAD-binding protein, partial [Inquilinus sp.]|nr:NAD-binding protein [Inquilinus sp.]
LLIAGTVLRWPERAAGRRGSMVVSKRAGMDLATAFEAIRISSGNSFVHETESQVILNGSYDIGFTMELVRKDLGLFQDVADRAGAGLELSPLLAEIFTDGAERYGAGSWSSMIVKRHEDACGAALRAPGFPPQLVDEEPEETGHEVAVPDASQTG